MYMILRNRNRLWMVILGLLVGLMALDAHADEGSDKRAYPSRPFATLNAEASTEVAHDTVTVRLAAEVSAASQTEATRELSRRLDAALARAKGDAKVKARSGSYRVWPATDRDGKISNWRGRGEVVLESTDFAAASERAGQLGEWVSVADLTFSVSHEARARQEAELLTQAAQAFRDRAQAVAQALGYAAYELRRVEVGGSGAQPYSQAPRMMAVAGMAGADAAPLPFEGGTERITVSVTGSVFLKNGK